MKKAKYQWHPIPGMPLTEVDKKVMYWEKKGRLVPSRKLIKLPEQIEGIRKSGLLNTAVLDCVEENIREGISTAEIDRLVYEYTMDHQGIPATLGYHGFPNSCCISVNEVVCHGIPNENQVLHEGDIVNVDCTTIVNGFYADASRMFIIGKTSSEKEKLVRVTEECLKKGVQAAQAFTFLGDVGHVIECHAKRNGFSVVRDFCGHGVGIQFHEEPEVLHYGRKNSGMLLVPGMTLTIEPMLNMGTWKVVMDQSDGWTVYTEDRLPSAQWEYTILITESKPEILAH